MDRADLHSLVDSMPKEALETAKRMLTSFQVWPPQRPPEMKQIRQTGNERLDRMLQSMRTRGIGGGGGYFYNSVGDYGPSGFSHIDGDTLVIETTHFHKGHEISITERFRLADDRNAILYTHEAKGPDGHSVVNEIAFDLK